MTIAGFFADGIDFQLPHPPLHESVLLVVHDAICCAIGLLRAAPPLGFNLATAPENSITQQLEWILENRLRKSGQVRGFDERVFHKVRRAPEVTNFDGKHPSKKPDLVFDLARDEPLILSSLDALFVECKPVDKAHTITKHYCSLGASRFVDGDYSWAMQEAMMVAYVRDGHSLIATLNPALAVDPQYTNLGMPSSIAVALGAQPNSFAELLHFTTHQRMFQWPGGKGPACPIRIFHSWHDCS